MFKFVVVCALLACASAQFRGLGHGHHNGLNHNNLAHAAVHHDLGHGNYQQNVDHHAAAQAHNYNQVHNHDNAHAETRQFNSDVHAQGFHYDFETTNNIKASASGDEHGNHQGDYEWVSPEGRHVSVKYVANENGFQPQGDVVPTPHPIPEAILRSIQYNAAHPHPHADGAYHEHNTHHGQTTHHAQAAHLAQATHNAQAGHHGQVAHFAPPTYNGQAALHRQAAHHGGRRF